MNLNAAGRGSLVLLGGSELTQIHHELMERLIHLPGKGNDIQVGIIATASETPDSMAERYIGPLTQLGIQSIRSIDMHSTSDLLAIHQSLETLDLLIFTGGDQLRLLDRFANDPFRSILRAFHCRGGIVAGSSAGAMVMGNPVIVRGEPEAFYERGALTFRDGFDLLENTIIDTHLVHRNRMGRLIHSACIYPGKTIIGIQESTGVIITPDRQLAVIGSGIAVVVESGLSNRITEEFVPDHLICGEDLRVSVIPRGSHIFLPHTVARCSRPQ